MFFILLNQHNISEMEEDKEKPKILIVEDDPRLGKTLSDILKAKDYSPLAVLTGKEGAAAAKKDDFSLALIDLKLPHIQGIEVLKEIKKNSPRTEVIILTAYASLDTAMEAVNRGAFSYLEKPYDMERLLLDIRRALERQRAKEALKSAEEWYRVTFEHTGTAMAILEEDTTISLVNKEFEALSGYTKKEIEGKKSWTEFVHPEDLERMKNHHEERRKGSGKAPTSYEFKAVDREGNIKDMYLSIEMIPGTKKSAISIIDITDRKRAEEALEHRILALTQPAVELGGLKLTDIIGIENLQNLQDNFAGYNRVASVIFDNNGEPITAYSNFSEFCKIIRSTAKGLKGCKRSDARLGRKAAEGATGVVQCGNIKEIMDGVVPIIIQGQCIANWGIGQAVTGDVDENEVREFAREIGADEEELVKASKKLVRMPKEGFERIIRFLDALTRQVSLLGLQNLQQARYITERKRLVNELEESRKFLETIIESIPDALYLKDSQYHVSLVNQAYCNRTGLTKEEIIGKERMRKNDEKIFKNGKLVEIPEQFFVDKGGESHYAHLKKVPLIDESGKITHVLTISRDITKHKRLDDERERVLKELKELDKLKTDLLNVAYHEMRSPLGPIVASASLLEQGYLSAKQKRLVFIIEQSVKQLEKLINRLLELTRIDTGKVELKLKTVSIPEIVKNVLGYLKPMADAKKQTITIDVPEGIEIEGDEQKITAIFDNLVSNAIKYTEKNGRIDIKVADRGGEDIVVSIADTGTGISEEQLSRVFERFFMADTSLSRKGGLGLGLSIVNEYVKLHGGKVWATSELGKGSNFFFTVPKKQRKKEKRYKVI